MDGTKAVAFDAWRSERDRACVRFDYSGHGEFGGDFVDGTIGRWLEESVAVFEQFCAGPQVVVGSSMGGWMALLLARELARRQAGRASLAALVLIAPAADFTEELMWKAFRRKCASKSRLRAVAAAIGIWRPLSDHAPPDRRRPPSFLLGGCHRGRMPVRILQGAKDPTCLATRLLVGGSVAGRRCGADHDPGRRPSAVSAAGYRADDCGGGGVSGEDSGMTLQKVAAAAGFKVCHARA